MNLEWKICDLDATPWYKADFVLSVVWRTLIHCELSHHVAHSILYKYWPLPTASTQLYISAAQVPQKSLTFIGST